MSEEVSFKHDRKKSEEEKINLEVDVKNLKLKVDSLKLDFDCSLCRIENLQKRNFELAHTIQEDYRRLERRFQDENRRNREENEIQSKQISNLKNFIQRNIGRTPMLKQGESRPPTSHTHRFLTPSAPQSQRQSHHEQQQQSRKYPLSGIRSLSPPASYQTQPQFPRHHIENPKSRPQQQRQYFTSNRPPQRRVPPRTIVSPALTVNSLLFSPIRSDETIQTILKRTNIERMISDPDFSPRRVVCERTGKFGELYDIREQNVMYLLLSLSQSPSKTMMKKVRKKREEDDDKEEREGEKEDETEEIEVKLVEDLKIEPPVSTLRLEYLPEYVEEEYLKNMLLHPQNIDKILHSRSEEKGRIWRVVFKNLGIRLLDHEAKRIERKFKKRGNHHVCVYIDFSWRLRDQRPISEILVVEGVPRKCSDLEIKVIFSKFGRIREIKRFVNDDDGSKMFVEIGYLSKQSVDHVLYFYERNFVVMLLGREVKCWRKR